MQSASGGLEADRETRTSLKRLVLEELGDKVVLDERVVDALARAIASLPRGERRDDRRKSQ